MNPFDALSAAAAIAQLLDYGIALTSRAVQIYRSPNGTSKELLEVERMASSFRDRAEETLMKAQRPETTGQPVDQGQIGLLNVAVACKDNVAGLLQLLQQLKPAGQKTFAKSWYMAYKIDRRHRQIEWFQRGIEELRKQLNEHILSLVSDRQCILATALRQMDRKNREFETQLLAKVDNCRSELLDAIQGPTQHQKSCTELGVILRDLERESRLAAARQSVLASLRFDTMEARSENIKSAYTSTYEWIFEEQSSDTSPPIRFRNWLEGGEDIYWITGKAGSGKSTLMKHIANHPQTRTALRTWAGDKKLFIATHYFWSPGTMMQKSQRGLLQSMLYEILRQCPELIHLVCASRWDLLATENDSGSLPWRLSELGECIDVLSKQQLSYGAPQACFCLFIDGLDEYEGDREDIVSLLKRLVGSSVKICASSRPWEVFEGAFKASTELDYRLDLHEHTAGDIVNVAHQELDSYLLERSNDGNELAKFIDEITVKAQGVFLWVSLVLKELIKSFRHADSIATLRRRLDEIPPGLTEYFNHIFRNIDPFYEQETARIFLVCLKAYEPLSVNAFGMLAMDKPELFATSEPIASKYNWFNDTNLEHVRKQVNGRCQDLLEVDLRRPSGRMYWDTQLLSRSRSLHRVQFLHRTVRDFLANEDMHDMLKKRAGATFNPSITLTAVYISLIKKTLSLFRGHRITLLQNWSNLALIHARDVERELGTTLLKAIAELDNSMCCVFPESQYHWTNWTAGLRLSDMNDPQTILSDLVGSDIANSDQKVPRHDSEAGQRDFLGHLIEMNLSLNVAEILNQDHSNIYYKAGRPYLHYALRSTSLDPASGNASTSAASTQADFALVRLLVSYGCSPNEMVGTETGSRTVWDVFLSQLYREESNTSAHLNITWFLIENGARYIEKCEVAKKTDESSARYHIQPGASTLSTLQILQAVFGAKEGRAMTAALENNAPRSWSSYLRTAWTLTAR